MIEKININSECYPDLLKEISDPPSHLYVDGKKELLKTRCVSVVGSRKCTQYGLTVAKNLGRTLGENGITLVSGMAKGIDGAAHLGALEAGGNTIAILGNGVDICYPLSNQKIYNMIKERGLIMSEYPEEYKGRNFTFPRRNRLISGISEATVVIEAPNRSGALITADAALDQSREVYAVPGNITSFFSFGCNKLIREGARPLIFLEDLVRDLNIIPKDSLNIESKLGKDEYKIYKLLKIRGEMSLEEIFQETKISPNILSGIITVLEMKSLIFMSMGKVFVEKF